MRFLCFIFLLIGVSLLAQPPFPTESRSQQKTRITPSIYHYMHPGMRSLNSPVVVPRVSKRTVKSPKDAQSEAIPMRTKPSREKPKGAKQ